MTIDHPIRRHLARVCSADTMARVVDPTLADVRWESGRPMWLGYMALLNALLIHAALSTPRVVGRVYSDDGHAVPKVAAFSVVGAILGAVPIGVLPFVNMIRHQNVPAALALSWLLLPQALVLTLPPALLIAILVAVKEQALSARLRRRVVVLSIGCAAITLAVLVWAVPEANQAFRVRMSGNAQLARGPSETGFTAMRRQIENLRTFHGGETAALRLEYVYHVRLALAGAAVPLGLLALGVARSATGRRRPWRLGIASVAFYAAVLFPFQRVVEPLLVGGTLPPSLLAWTPNLVMGLFAALFFYSSIPAAPDSSAAS